MRLYIVVVLSILVATWAAFYLPGVDAQGPTGTLQFQTYLAPGSGAVTRSGSAKVGDMLSVLDYGADPTGTSSSQTPITNALTAATTSMQTVWVPPGTYLVSGITVPPGVDIRGVPGASILQGTSSSNPVMYVGSTLVYGNRFGLIQGLVFNCNSVAGIGLSVELAVMRRFSDLVSENCGTVAYQIDTTQNSQFFSLDAESSAICYAIYNGAGNNIFTRAECYNPGATGWYLGQNSSLPGYSWGIFANTPTSNTISRTVIENGGMTRAVWEAYGLDNSFEDGNWSTNTLGTGMTAMLEVDSNSSLSKFYRILFNTGTSTAPHVINNGYQTTMRDCYHNSTVGIQIQSGNDMKLFNPFLSNSGDTLVNLAGSALANLQMEYTDQVGPTAGRPSYGGVGYRSAYFDTTVGYAVWYNGAGWVNAAGNAPGGLWTFPGVVSTNNFEAWDSTGVTTDYGRLGINPNSAPGLALPNNGVFSLSSGGQAFDSPALSLANCGGGGWCAGNGSGSDYSATLQSGVVSSDPGCTSSSHIGKLWFNVSTSTTVFKVCTNNGGTVGWSLPGGGALTNPMTTLGDVIYGGTSGTPTRLAGNSSAATEVLTSTGTGSAANAPIWVAWPFSTGVPSASCGSLAGTNSSWAVSVPSGSVTTCSVSWGGSFSPHACTMMASVGGANPAGFISGTGIVIAFSTSVGGGFFYGICF